MENLAEYITHNYGTCRMTEEGNKCICLKNGWIGKGCFSWKPFAASTWEELREFQNKIAPIA